MKIEFYTTIVKDENNKFRGFSFSVIPTLCITECGIYLHWLFWGIDYTYKK